MSTTIRQIPGRIDASLRSPWQVRALSIVDAVILNLVILVIGRVVIGDFPMATVSGDEQTVGLVQVIGVTALVGLVAAGLLAVLDRLTTNAKTIWTAIALIVFAASLLGPLGSGVDTSSKVVLALLHVGAAATIIPLMRRSVGMGE